MNTKNEIIISDFERITASLKDIEAFRNKNFLVTGATGLIGSLVVNELLYLNKTKGMGIRVFALVRDTAKAEKIFGKADSGLEFLVHDLAEGNIDLKGEKIDYIIHAAAVTNSKMMVTYPVETLNIAYQGTFDLLKIAHEQKVSGMVYISSMEVYGQMNKDEKTTENDLGYVDLSSVRTCYPEGKRVCECLVNSFAKEYGVPVKTARLAQTFGAGVSVSENRVFAQFAKSAMKDEDIVLHTTGESEGNYVYTADAVAAIMLLLTDGEPGESYNVSNENSHMKIHEMAAMVAERFSDGKSKLVFDIPEDANVYGFAPAVHMHLSNQKLCALGWHPSVDLPEQYHRMIEYWKSEDIGGK